ncbi:MAG: NAD-dependent epimerase/dehydratase family protein [Ilumatobacteraceae bacterium]
MARRFMRGDGRQARDVTYVDDVAAAIVAALAAPVRPGTAVNIGAGRLAAPPPDRTGGGAPPVQRADRAASPRPAAIRRAPPPTPSPGAAPARVGPEGGSSPRASPTRLSTTCEATAMFLPTTRADR